MRKIVLTLVILGFSIVGFSQYETPSVSNTSADTSWQSNYIRPTSKAVKFSDLFYETIMKPGDTVLAKANLAVKLVEMKDVFYAKYLLTKEGVVFDKDTKLINYATKQFFVVNFSVMIVIVFVSILLALISNAIFFFGRERKGFAAYILVAALILGAAAAITPFVALLAASSAVAVTILNFVGGKKRKYVYITVSAIYYFATAIGLILLYCK